MTSSLVTNFESTLIAEDLLAAYQATVAELGGGRIPFMKYKDGKWFDDKGGSLDGGMFLADIANARHGFVLFKEGKCVGLAMTHVAHARPLRSELPNPDAEWKACAALQLRDAKTGTEFIWNTNSGGGMRAIGGLLDALIRRAKLGLPKAVPLVELGTSGYTHREFGYVDVPTLRVVDWVPEPTLNRGRETAESIAAATVDAGDGPMDDIPF